MTYSKQELIDEIKMVSEEVDGTPTTEDFRKNSDMSPSTISRRMGSWNKALEKSGLELNRTYGLTKNEIKQEVLNISEKYYDGGSPYKSDIKEYASFSVGVIYDRFGSWNSLLKECGLKLHNGSSVGKEELIEEIHSIRDEYDKIDVPTVEQMNKYGQYSGWLYQKNFQNWAEALREAGFDPNQEFNIPEEKCLKEIRRLYTELENTPRAEDMNKIGRYSVDLYEDKFGSWNSAIKQAGLEINSVPSGEDHVRWKGGYGHYYGPNWWSQRKKAWQRDDFKCRVCGITEEEMGRKPDVHHIKPKSEFNVYEEHEEMNDLSNLISLCRTHHNKVDGKWKEASHECFEKKALEYFYS